jgi:hypothetical protein
MMDDNLFDDYESESGLMCEVCGKRDMSVAHRFDANGELLWICDNCLEDSCIDKE